MASPDITLPSKTPRWALPFFLVLVALGVAEASVAVPSWHLIYPVIKDRLSFLTQFFAAAEQFATWPTTVVAMILIWTHRPDLRRSLPVFLIGLALATTITDSIKTVTGRARPDYGVRMVEARTTVAISEYMKANANPILKPEPGDYWMWFSPNRPGLDPRRLLKGDLGSNSWNTFGEYDSFPSGHATSGMALATFLALMFPQSRGLWYLFAVGCAVSRIRFRRHYPADVIVGCAIGWYVMHLVFAWRWPFRVSDWLLARMDRNGK